MKKLLAIVLVGMMVLSFAACGGGAKVEEKTGVKVTFYEESWETWEEGNENLRLAVDFYYPEDAGIEVEIDEEYPNWGKLYYTDKNILISPSLFEDTTFDDNKEYAKENEDTYTEFELNGYNCYAYEDFGGYWIYVHIEEVSENTDRYLVIDTSVIDYSKDYVEGVAQYEDEDIKKIVNSFEYRGLVEYPEVENVEE